jgi:hypothetical protein
MASGELSTNAASFEPPLGQHGRHRSRFRRQEANEEKGSALLAKQRRRDDELAPAVGQPGTHVLGPAGGAHAGEQRLQLGGAVGIEAVGEDAADDASRGLAEQRAGRRVGLDDLAAHRVDDEHGLGTHLEQQAVARLEVAQPRVVPLHRLLRLDQPLLQSRRGAEVAAAGDDRPVRAEPHGAVEDRNVGAPGGGMIDLPPARRMGGRRLLDQGLDLAAGLAGHGVDPWQAEPFAVPFDRPVVAAEGDVADDPVGVDDERDVAHGGDQRRRHVGVEFANRIPGNLNRITCGEPFCQASSPASARSTRPSESRG